MTDDQTVTVLRAATDAELHGHHLDPGVAATAWSAAQGRPRPLRRYLAIAATVVGVVGASTALAITQTNGGRAGSSAGQPAGASACTGNVSTGTLPTWARGGFTNGGGLPPRHVIGDHRGIIAVLFVNLRVHQPYPAHNKILWVARSGTGPLHIRARLEGSSDTVTRTLANGPGPSYVDMPAAGCWQMTLQWSGHHDTLALRYLP